MTEPSTRSSVLPVLLTLFVALSFFVFMTLVTGGFFFYVALAVFFIGGIGTLHYLTWGHTLTREVVAEEAAEQMRAKALAQKQIDSRVRRRGLGQASNENIQDLDQSRRDGIQEG